MILGTHNMTGQIEAKHDLTPNEIDAIEDRLYHHTAMQLGVMTAEAWAL
jgi:hypothetical protein